MSAKPNRPSIIIAHGVASVGKTSFAFAAQKPIGLQSKHETGVQSLLDAGSIKPGTVGFFPECQSWTHALDCLDCLIEEPHEYKTVVLDVLNGFERMLHEHVCNRDYGGSAKIFGAYKQGPETAINDWRQLLSKLDELRNKRNMTVILLAHTTVRPFRNPEGADYDRFTVDVHPATWSVTWGWSDVTLFMHYETFLASEVEGKKQARPKATGGNRRVMYTERTAAYDAKNRFGLPTEIDMGASGAEAWKNFSDAVKTARQSKGGDS